MKKSNIKKSDIIIVTLILLLLSTLLWFGFKPRPVLSEQDDVQIGYILKYVDGDTVQVEGYDSDEILTFLQICPEKRTFELAGGYLGDDVDIEIYLQGFDGSPSKDILLGNINYSYNVDAKWRAKYKIINADYVKAELLKMLDQ